MTQKHEREIVRWLRDTWPITDLKVAYGGKHPRISFTYGGKRRSCTISGTPRDFSTSIFQAKRQLAKMLGSPPQVERVERKEIEMLAEPQAFNTPRVLPTKPESKAVVARGSVALYTTTSSRHVPRQRLEVKFSDDLYKALPTGARLMLKDDDIGGDEWTFMVSPLGAKISQHSKQWGITRYSEDVKFSTFGATPAEFLYENGTMLVRLAQKPKAVNEIRSFSQKRRADILRRREQTAAPTPVSVPTAQPAETAPTPQPATSSAVNRALIQSTVSLIRRIEAETDYRLVKVRGSDGNERWSFRVPPIE